MAFAEGKQLTLRSSGVTISWHRTARASIRWLCTHVFLKSVITMNPVFFAHVVAEVARPLIELYRSRCRPEKLRSTGVIGYRNQRNQRAHSGIGRGQRLSPLGGGQDSCTQGKSLPLSQPFVGSEEEQFVLDNRTADIPTEVIANELRLLHSDLVEEISG